MDQNHALCRQQTKSLWVGEGFDRCNVAGCILTGPIYVAIRQWGLGLKMGLFLHGGRGRQQQRGYNGVGKYHICSVSACDDSYQILAPDINIQTYLLILNYYRKMKMFTGR